MLRNKGRFTVFEFQVRPTGVRRQVEIRNLRRGSQKARQADQSMENTKRISNEAEFERWLIAALERQRQLMFGADRDNQGLRDSTGTPGASRSE